MTPSSTNGPLGLSARSTAGVDMGFNREPGGTLNSVTTGGKTYHYPTDAIGSVIGLVDVDGNKVDSYAYSPRGVRILAQSTEPVAQPYTASPEITWTTTATREEEEWSRLLSRR